VKYRLTEVVFVFFYDVALLGCMCAMLRCGLGLCSCLLLTLGSEQILISLAFTETQAAATMISRQSSSYGSVVVSGCGGADRMPRLPSRNPSQHDKLEAERSESTLNTRSATEDHTDASSVEQLCAQTSTHPELKDWTLPAQPNQELLIRLIAKEMVESLLKRSGQRSTDKGAADLIVSPPRYPHSLESSQTSEDETFAAFDDVPDHDLEAKLKDFAENLLQSSGFGRGDGLDCRLRDLLRASLPTSLDDASSDSSDQSATSRCDSFAGATEGEDLYPQKRNAEAAHSHLLTDSDGRGLPGSTRPPSGNSIGSNKETPSPHGCLVFLRDSSNHLSPDDQSVCSDLTGFTSVFDDDTSFSLTHENDETAQEDGSTTSTCKAHASGSDQCVPLASPAEVSSSSDIATPLKKKSRTASLQVSFAEVKVRFYNRIVSDHPACSGGPPVGIGWEYTPEEKFDFDDWEDVRDRLRSRTGLLLDRPERERMLRDWGFGKKELASAARELHRTKAQRRQTIHNLGAHKMEEALEQAARKMKSLLFLGKA
jgi:hypothetical protein